MLELKQYPSVKDKNKYLEQLDFSKLTLIVSDLSSKLYWQDYLIQKNGFVAGPQVMRAEDYWKLLLQRTIPEVEFVSRSWMTAYLKQILTHELLDSVGLPHAKTSTVIKVMNEFLPIISHPDSREIMQHWFDDVQSGSCSWRKWFELSEIIWATVSNKKQILVEWAASFLIQAQNFEVYWNRNLVVDLGPELRSIEAELLQVLSLKNQVQVLSPNPSWITEFHWISYPYKQFLSRSYKIEDLKVETSFEAKPVGSKFFKRFASTLGEVKFVVGQIQEWLAAGRNQSEIAIIAPDIEDYWPVLSIHLKKEGLIFEKPEKYKVGSIGSVIAWLSYLKKQKFSSLQFSELQLSCFHPINQFDLINNGHLNNDLLLKQQNPNSIEINQNLEATASFETLRSQWSNRSYENVLVKDSQSKLTAADFMAWAIQAWPHITLLPSMVFELCQKWLYEAENLGPLSAQEWIGYIQDFLNSQECETTSVASKAIGVYSLMSGIPTNKSLHLFLGCSESQLKSTRGLVSGADVLSLQHHTGHLLAHPDRDFREFQLRSLQELGEEQYFIFPESDFSGAELVPSIFWMKGREEEVQRNGFTSKHFHQLDLWNPGLWEQEMLKFNEKKSEENYLINEKLNHKISFSLSPASLKSYVECPFKFFAEKGLKLTDPQIVDLDLDARTSGSLQHKLLELLTAEPFDIRARRDQLTEVVESTLESQKDHYYSEKTKDLIRKQLHQLGIKFLEHEDIYRKEFPRFYTLACEAWFQKSIEVDGKNVNIRGKIDRIDMSVDGSEAIVIDYKNDIKSYSHAPSWIKNLEFQMPAYVQALETGAAKSETSQKINPTPVVAAHYYSLRDFTRKGFTLDEANTGVITPLSTTGTISKETKNQIIAEFQNILVQSAQKIIDGDFRAIPHPKTDCNNCNWRNLCRTRQPNL